MLLLLPPLGGPPAALLLLLAQILHAGLLVPGEAACTAPEPEAARSQGARERCSLRHRVQAEAPPAGCVCHPATQLCQPCRLSAKVNESVTLPCAFSYDDKRKPPLPTREVIQVSWRLGWFHGRVFFNPTEHYTHPEFLGRVTLVGDPLKRHDASIRIEALKESDANVYFCRISVQEGPHWQSIEGTNLTIEGGTSSLPVTEAPPTPPSGTLPGALTGAGLLTAVALLGLVMFFAWRKGYCSRHPGRRSPEERAEEAPELGLQRATATQHGGPAPLQPPAASGESGLTYATLVLPQAGAKQVPRRGAEEETTYAAI